MSKYWKTRWKAFEHIHWSHFLPNTTLLLLCVTNQVPHRSRPRKCIKFANFIIALKSEKQTPTWKIGEYLTPFFVAREENIILYVWKKFSFVFLSSLGRIFFKCTKKLVPSGSTFMLLYLCSAGPTLQGGKERVLKEKHLSGQIFNNRFRKWSKKPLPFIQIWPGVGMGFTLPTTWMLFFCWNF